MTRKNPTSAVVIALVACLGLAMAGGAAAQVDTGSLDFTRYVSLGDSLTAGFTSGGLVDSAQRNSYPALIWRQANSTADGFEQPLVSSPGIPSLLQLNSLSPLSITPIGGQGTPINLFLPRPYNNLAVPGSRVQDTVSTFTDNGGLHDLILRPGPTGFGTATALQQALAQQPSIVTLWIGNNDVLGAATSGIVLDGITLTTAATFRANFEAIVGAVRAAGAELVVATIPNVTAIPFITTLPPVLVDPATSQPVLINGQPVPLIGPNGPLGPGDRVLLPASGALALGLGIPVALGGTGLPLPDSVVLDAGEVATITARVAEINGIIREVAGNAGAGIVDMNAIFDDVAANGLDFGGLSYSEDFLTGGLFSYDGVHATDFGYAFVANEFIEVINATFGASIPPVDLFPFTFGGGSGIGLTAAEVGQVIYAPESYESLRRTLRLPSTERLMEIKERRERRRGNRGNGPGGPGSPHRPQVLGGEERPNVGGFGGARPGQ